MSGNRSNLISPSKGAALAPMADKYQFATTAQAQTAPQATGAQGYSGLAIFLTGFSGAGKSTIARELGSRFGALGYRVTMLDGDDLRSRVSPDLGFSAHDRRANLRRAAMIASEVVKHGGIAICSFIAPYEQSRAEVRTTVEEHGKFFLVHVATPLAECEQRDPKGLYRKARAGLIANFTGISDVYENPTDCEVRIDTTKMTTNESVDRLVRGLAPKGLPAVLWAAAGLRITSSAGVESATEPFPHWVNQRHQVNLFRRILRSTADRRLTMAEVAHTVGIERHAVEKVVRSIAGQSFRELQNSLLLERANMFLEEGKSIKAIAFDLGFGSPQSFHRFVKRVSGHTPSSLRKSDLKVNRDSSLRHFHARVS